MAGVIVTVIVGAVAALAAAGTLLTSKYETRAQASPGKSSTR